MTGIQSFNVKYLCFGEAEAGSQVLSFLSDDVLVAVERFLESNELGRREGGADTLRFAVVQTRKCGRLSRCLGANSYTVYIIVVIAFCRNTIF